jgi:hypothetical protein
VSVLDPHTLAQDDEQARRARLLLLGKGAGLAHRLDHRLTAGLDEEHPRRCAPPVPASCIGTAWALSPAVPRSLSQPPLSQSPEGSGAIRHLITRDRSRERQEISAPLLMPGGKSRLARRDPLVENAAVSGAHELGGKPVGPPLVVDHDASPRGPR